MWGEDMSDLRDIEIYIESYPVQSGASGYVTAAIITTGKRHKEFFDYAMETESATIVRGLGTALANITKPCRISIYTTNEYLKHKLSDIEETKRSLSRSKYKPFWDRVFKLAQSHKIALKENGNTQFSNLAALRAMDYAVSLERYEQPDIKTAQFPTESEAYEEATEHRWKIKDIQLTDSGVLLKYTEPATVPISISPLKQSYYVVTTLHRNGAPKLYVSDSGGTTFNIGAAKKFLESEAKSKAAGMTKNSRRRYTWIAQKIFR